MSAPSLVMQSQPSQDHPSQNLPVLTDAETAVASRRGGVVGNRGGKGRVPTRVRRRARESFDRLTPRFEAIAAGEKVKQTVTAVHPVTKELVTGDVEVIPEIRDQVKAYDTLGKYGLSGNISVDDVRARLVAQANVIREMLGNEQGELVLKRLSRVWRS